MENSCALKKRIGCMELLVCTLTLWIVAWLCLVLCDESARGSPSNTEKVTVKKTRRIQDQTDDSERKKKRWKDTEGTEGTEGTEDSSKSAGDVCCSCAVIRSHQSERVREGRVFRKVRVDG